MEQPSCTAVLASYLSCGLWTHIQNKRFQSSLMRGDIPSARQAIRSGATPYLNRHQIYDLLKENQVEPVQFLLSKIQFDTNQVDGGSKAAEEIIAVRDDTQIGAQHLAVLVPYQTMKKTYLYEYRFDYNKELDAYMGVRHFRLFRNDYRTDETSLVASCYYGLPDKNMMLRDPVQG